MLKFVELVSSLHMSLISSVSIGKIQTDILLELLSMENLCFENWNDETHHIYFNQYDFDNI